MPKTFVTLEKTTTTMLHPTNPITAVLSMPSNASTNAIDHVFVIGQACYILRISVNCSIRKGQTVTPLELRITRKRANLTQAKMANLLNISRGTLNRWEKGHWAIDADVTSRLSDAGIAIETDYSPAIYAYRHARAIFKRDHMRALRMAKVTLADQGAPGFTTEDMKQLAIEFVGVVPDGLRAQLIEANNAR